MKLLVSAFLLLALGYLATAEVVASFTGTCSNFFLRNQPPTGPTGTQYKEICQKRVSAGGYEFATLYDTNLRIPVYSAYEYQGYLKCNRNASWYIEPQLDDPNGGKEMNTEGTVTKPQRGVHQALNGDYLHSGYDKGHLVPVRHRYAQQCTDATFTLTNAAPQTETFNGGVWRVTEANVAKTLDTNCVNLGFHAYVVTGVVPGNTNMNGRVNIPSRFWSAYCCVNNNNVHQFSGAFYGNNDNSKTVTTIAVAGLNNILGFRVFGNNC